MERTVAQLDHEGFFVGTSKAYGRGLPGNAREEFPPEGDLPEHHRWRWVGKAYEATPDYRGQTVYKPDGTTYHPATWGPLPDGDSLDPPPPSPEEALAEAIAGKKAEVLSGYEAAFAPVYAPYSATERDGWNIQLEEALAVLDGREADAPTLALMVQERGMDESLTDFAQLIVSKNLLYRPVYAFLTGQQQRMYRDVESMAAMPGITADEVAAYLVEYQMPEGF
jgi:hypothetical protein